MSYVSDYAASSANKKPSVTVQRGDTLSKIAKEAGTTVKEIIAANPKFTRFLPLVSIIECTILANKNLFSPIGM